jgi:aspartyl-tRNA(Asn)/glutamyl-tRNA(Gln) amidotransferase subunit B
LNNNFEASKFFDSIEYPNREILAKFFFSEVLPLAKNKNIQELNIKPQDIVDLINFSISGTISGKQLKVFFPKLVNLKTSVEDLIKSAGSVQISDEKTLTPIINDIIKQNPHLIDEFIERQERCLKFVIGQLMKLTKGQANPIVATKITTEILETHVKEK